MKKSRKFQRECAEKVNISAASQSVNASQHTYAPNAVSELSCQMLHLKGSQAGFVRTLARQKKVTLTLIIIIIKSLLGWVISFH